MTFSKKTFAARILWVTVIGFCCGMLAFSLAKAILPGNPEAAEIAVSPEPVSREGESAAAALFHKFYTYQDAPRGMVALRFRDNAGQERTLEDYRGRVILLNFWATWCAPCARELPTLQVLQNAHGGEDFTVLAASADFGVPTARIFEFMKKNNAPDLPFVMLEETDGVWEIVSAGLPITFVIDRDGRVIYKMLGEADWGNPALTALISNLLKNSASAGKN